MFAQMLRAEDAWRKAEDGWLSLASMETQSPGGTPMGMDMMKFSTLKSQAISLPSNTSTRSASPVTLPFDAESLASPMSGESTLSWDSEGYMGSPAAWGNGGLDASPAAEYAGSCVSPKGPLPPAPWYPAPDVAKTPGLPPAPALPPRAPIEPPRWVPPPPAPAGSRRDIDVARPTVSLPPFHPAAPPAAWPKTAPPSAAPRVTTATVTPPAPPAPAWGPATPQLPPAPALQLAAPQAGMATACALGLGITTPPQPAATAPRLAEGSLLPPQAPPLLASQTLRLGMPGCQASPCAPFSPFGAGGHRMPLPCEAVREDYHLAREVDSGLMLLSAMKSGPSVPPLPPGGCYGRLHISSAISDALSSEATQAAEVAASQLGYRPVKVLLPWYPAHASVGMFDTSRPAKVSTVAEVAGASCPPGMSR